MEDIVLPNTSLCAIVRDEKMNPAGGIVRFLNSILPHVEEAIIVDTGSKDGTREILEQQKGRFPHLKVYDTKFEGYARARNFSLKQAKTDKVLVLDADEIILQEDFLKIKEILEKRKEKAFVLSVQTIGYELNSFPVDKPDHDSTLGVRLLDPRKYTFYNMAGWKYECVSGNSFFREIPISFLHFVPPIEIISRKVNDWYFSGAFFQGKAPSELAGFSDWKRFNPARDKYKASNLDVLSSS